MKARLTVLGLLLFFVSSCSKESDDLFSSEKIVKDASKIHQTSFLKSTANYSNYFDWENTNFVTVNGSQIALPWVPGANTTIPTSTLLDMKKVNGWDLYYNTIDWAYSSSNQKYLIFYNKFRGLARVFFFNSITSSSTSGVMNFLIESNIPTKLGNTLIPISDNMASSKFFSTATVLTEGDYSAFRLGWNCFDIPIEYDPNLDSSSATSFSVFSDQQTISNIALTGSFTSESKGQIVTEGKSNPLSSIVNGVCQKAGTLATGYLNAQCGGALSVTGLTPAMSNFMGNILSKGVNSVFSSFIGTFDQNTSQIQQLSFTTEGKTTLQGTISTGTPGVVESVKSLPFPGTCYTNGGLLPCLNDTWGVFTITSTPIIRYNTYAKGSGKYIYQNLSLDANLFDVVLNPSVLSTISNFTVTKELWFYKRYNGKGLGSKQNFESGIEGGTLVYSDFENQFIREPNNRIKFFNELYIEERYLGVVEQPIDGINKSFIFKVTVTLYPKAPYSTNPVVLSRSFYPSYVAN